MITLHRLEPNTLLGFKALPSWEDADHVLQAYHDEQCTALRAHFPHTKALHERVAMAAAPSSAPAPVVDWSGLYVQLDVASAVHYLPNQWDRGQTEAQLVALYTTVNAPMAVLCCREARLADPTLRSTDKARLVRDAISAFLDTCGGDDKVEEADEARARLALVRLLRDTPSSSQTCAEAQPLFPLVAALGLYGYALCLPDADAEAYELVLPHTLHVTATTDVHGARVHAEPLFHLSVSTRLPGCTGAVQELPTLGARLVADPRDLATALVTSMRTKMPVDAVDDAGLVQWWATVRHAAH